MADRDASGTRLTKLGRYEVLSELGKGAMGVVYLAKDPVIGRMVAVKTIRASTMGDDDSESREFRERFIREAQTAGILSHPNIVTIHDIGEDPETQISFIAMEYIEGKTLKGLLVEKAAFSWDQIADMIAQVAEAVDYAHRKGIIHRDIKPANIIVTTADEKVKITDFGIAKIASSNLTTTGQFLGTPNYMSPEQVSGSPVDGRSDIFSLGVVLYELLTRRKPFSGENLTAISYKIVHEDFIPPAEMSNEVPPEFNPIVARAMAKDPWNRYQRGKDFALALQQLRAHLEEQRAMTELGTIVSSPSNVSTQKLENLAAIAAEGARQAGEASASSRATVPETAPAPVSEALGATQTASRRTPAAPAEPPSVPPAPPAVPATTPPAGPGTTPRTLKLSEMPRGNASAAVKRGVGAVTAVDWRKLTKEQVNPLWFWRITIGAAALLLLVVGILVVRRASAARPSVEFDSALAQEVSQRRHDLDEGKKLYAAGRYQESLALFRKMLDKDPNSRTAREYAQKSEGSLQGKEQEARKSADAEKGMQLAQAALNEGNFEEARKRAEEVLSLDGSRADAQKVREDAEKMAQAADAAKKKSARVAGAARRPTTVVARGRGTEAAPTAVPAPAPAATSVPILRLLFDSPISEGHVMVAVNDQILLRRPFSFTRKQGLFKTVKETGTVDVSIPVQTGALNVKVWLSGPDIPASTFATTSTQMPGGGSRVLRLEYSGGHLSAKIQ
jgi:tRNA A-37 threonylcarbamoyl transferase component Bud32/tetratricopeptide (TPR) repeat protein